jgi:hypothetical protein
METLSNLGNNIIRWFYTQLQTKIWTIVVRVSDIFKEPELMLVSHGEHVPSRELVESFCKRRGVKGILTQSDHDVLLDSLRGYNFSDAVAQDTRTRLNAYDFWNTDLPPLSK